MLHAVVVGINDYRDSRIPQLTCAVKDAVAVAALFERIPSEQRRVRLLVNAEATRENIAAAVGVEIAQRAECEDSVVIYFAGHGHPELHTRTRFLVAHDAAYPQVFPNGFDLEADIGLWLQRLKHVRLVVVLLDTCFSGAAGGRSFAGPLPATQLGRTMDLRPVQIRHLDLGKGRALMCAADEDQAALEDRSLGHGLFTHSLLSALKKPRAKNTVSVTQLYDEVVDLVRDASHGRQVPTLSIVRAASPRLPSFADRH